MQPDNRAEASPKILAIDDEPTLLQAISRILRSAHYEVLEASTAQDGLRLARKHTPEMILVSVALPDLDGIEFCRRIKADPTLRDCFVVLLSSLKTDSEEQAQGLESGADGYIARPTSNRELLARVQTLLRLKQTQDALREARSELEGRVRQRTEELRASEEHHRTLVHNIPIGVCRTTPGPAGRFLMANPAFLCMLGLDSIEELQQYTMADFFLNPEDRKAFSQRLLTQGRVTGIELQLKNRDGAPIWGSVTAQVVQAPYTDEPIYFDCTIEDITARKQAQKDLRAFQEYARSILDSSLDMIITVDLDRRIVEFTQAAQQTFGYRPEEVIGQHIDILYADPEESNLVHQTAIASGQCIREIRNRRKNGEVFPSYLSASVLRDANDNVIGVMGISRDISKQKQAEEALQQRTRELAMLHRASQALSSTLDLNRVFTTILDEVRHLLNVVASSIWLTDPATGELVCQAVTDPKSEIVRGWRLAPGQGLVGWVARTGESLIVPDTKTETRHFKGVDRQTGLKIRSILTVPLRVKEQVIGALQVVDKQVDRFTPRDQTLLESLAASAAVAIENARLYDEVQSYAVEMATRVAERTRKLSDAYDQLKELDRMKSKFVTDVSHELRTPVANIKLYLHLLADAGPEKGPRFLKVLNEQTDRLTGLLETILDLSRFDIGVVESEFKSVDMNSAAGKIVETNQSRAEARKLSLTFEPDPDLPPVHANRDQLGQVITNLLDNAINYTPAGQIHVSTHLDGTRKEACLQITDTGRGISPQDLPHIFDRFYRGQDVGSSNIPGSGLGLAIVKEIVERHGGRIEVESKEKEGSTFRVWLPLAEKRVEE